MSGVINDIPAAAGVCIEFSYYEPAHGVPNHVEGPFAAVVVGLDSLCADGDEVAVRNLDDTWDCGPEASGRNGFKHVKIRSATAGEASKP